MATVQSKLEQILTWLYTSTTQFPLAEALVRFQECDNDLRNNIIKEVWEDYYWDILYTDLVTSQDEYVTNRVEILSDVWVDILKLKRLWIKYSTDTQYKEVKSIDWDYFSFDYDYLKINQPASTPVFFRKDNSVFIYPTETTTATFTNGSWDTITWVQDWLKLWVILWWRELALATEMIDTTTGKNNLAVKSQFYWLYDLYLASFIHRKAMRINESLAMMREYERKRFEMTSILSDNIDVVVEETLPYTANLE